MGKTLIKNRITALLLVLIVSGLGLFLPMLYLLVGILIALITLTRGSQDGAMMAGWALLPLLAFGIAQSFDLPLLVVIASVLLVWVLSSVLYRWSSWRLVMEVSVGIGVATVMVITAFFPEFLNALAMAVATFFKELQSMQSVSFTEAQLKTMTHLSLGYLTAEAIFSEVLALIIARGWQARLFNPGGFAEEFRQLRLGKVMLVALGVAVLGAYFEVDLALQLIPVLLLPFLFAGFGLFHAVVHQYVRAESKPFALGFFYFNCLFFFYFALPMVIFAAFVDSLYDFRRHFVVE